MEKRLGEEVRGSIHNAIEKINDVSEVIITVGTLVDSDLAPIEGYYQGSLYLNRNTYDLWRCTGMEWELLTNLKGEKGDKGSAGLSVRELVDNLDGTFSQRLSDGSVTNPIPLLAGEKGDKGEKGDAGENGLTIVGFREYSSGAVHTYSAIMSDGSEVPIPGAIKDGVMQGGAMTKGVYAKNDDDDEGYVDKALSLVDKQGNVITVQTVQSKATRATSLQGYGIQDAYTKDEVDQKIDEAGGGTWDQLKNKPFNTIGKGLTTYANALRLDSETSDKLNAISITDQYIANMTYHKGDLVIQEGIIYRLKVDSAVGIMPPDEDYWEAEASDGNYISYGREIGNLQRITTANVTSTSWNSVPTVTKIGKLCILSFTKKLNKGTYKKYNSASDMGTSLGLLPYKPASTVSFLVYVVDTAVTPNAKDYVTMTANSGTQRLHFLEDHTFTHDVWITAFAVYIAE